MTGYQLRGEPCGMGALDVPGPVAHVWGWFWQLEQGRQSNGYGPQALSHVQIESWSRLYGVTLRAWEVDAIMAMDTSRRAALKPPENPEADTGLRRVVSLNDTAAAMAMFDRFTRTGVDAK